MNERIVRTDVTHIGCDVYHRFTIFLEYAARVGANLPFEVHLPDVTEDPAVRFIQEHIGTKATTVIEIVPHLVTLQ
jgi:hypothetical protein